MELKTTVGIDEMRRCAATCELRRAAFLIVFSSLLLLYGTGPLAGAPEPASGAQTLNQAFIAAVKAVSPAVVHVRAERPFSPPRELRDLPRFFREIPREWPFRGPGERGPQPRLPSRLEIGYGSGLLFGEDNYVLTIRQVVEGAERVIVLVAEEQEFTAEIVAVDQPSGLALLRIPDKVRLPRAKLGDSERLELGEWVIAVGNPAGIGLSVSAGIVCSRERGEAGAEGYENLIQTDAAIGIALSGGPLVNLEGEVVGINVAPPERGEWGNRLGFAIPINSAKWVVKEILEKGRVSRGYLGVMIQDVTPDLAQQFGVRPGEGALVTQVQPEGAADRAGMRPRDIILEVNGKSVRGVRMLQHLISQMVPGTAAELVVLRDGKRIELRATLGERETEAVAPRMPERDLGMTLQDLTLDLARELGLKVTEGVLITEVQSGSPADRAGITRDSVITEVDQVPVRTVDEYRQAMARAGKDRVLMLVHTPGGPRYIVLKRE